MQCTTAPKWCVMSPSSRFERHSNGTRSALNLTPSLALDVEHALVIGTHQHHGGKPRRSTSGSTIRIPRADYPAGFIRHLGQGVNGRMIARGEFSFLEGVQSWPRAAKVRFIARPGPGLGNVQSRSNVVAHKSLGERRQRCIRSRILMGDRLPTTQDIGQADKVADHDVPGAFGGEVRRLGGAMLRRA